MQMHLSFCSPLMDKGWVQRDWVGHGDIKMSCLRERGKPCTPPWPGLGQCVHKQPAWMPVIFFCLWYFLNPQVANLVSPGSLAHICYCRLISFPAMEPSLAINTKDISFVFLLQARRWTQMGPQMRFTHTELQNVSLGSCYTGSAELCVVYLTERPWDCIRWISILLHNVFDLINQMFLFY